MTKHETFKRRIRERMLKTGERYGAARRALLSSPPDVDPGHPDDAIEAKTGHRWNDWVALIEAGPGRDAGHTAIAAWVHQQGVPGWWAQAVTVGYERLTGLRVPGQMADGTFSFAKSRVVDIPRDALRALLLDGGDRADLIPGFETELRSKADSKSLRFGFSRDGESIGTVQFSFDLAPGERLRLTVTHDKLASAAESEHWKSFWGEWLDAVEELTA